MRAPTDPLDLGIERVYQAKNLIIALQVADDEGMDGGGERLVPKVMQGSLYAIQILLQQATDALGDLADACDEGKPDVPIMMDREPITDLAAIKDTLPIGYSPRIEAVIKRCQNPESVRQYLAENGIYRPQLMRRIKDTMH